MTAAKRVQINETNEPEDQLFRKGDMALILGADGSVRTAAFDVDTSRLHGDPEQMTEEDERVLDQGQKLFALGIAANSTLLMNILIEISANPDIVDLDSLKKFMRPN
jgi:hypothetical protein